MISPNTPPGTEVVAISDDYTPRCPLPLLKVGEIYVVTEMALAFDDDVIVHVSGVDHEEYDWGYGREAFRYLDLAGLDALLNVKEKEPERA